MTEEDCNELKFFRWTKESNRKMVIWLWLLQRVDYSTIHCLKRFAQRCIYTHRHFKIKAFNLNCRLLFFLGVAASITAGRTTGSWKGPFVLLWWYMQNLRFREKSQNKKHIKQSWLCFIFIVQNKLRKSKHLRVIPKPINWVSNK